MKIIDENPRKKVSINSKLKAIYIIGQRKAFCGQKFQSLADEERNS